jgi:hypothetical protein
MKRKPLIAGSLAVLLLCSLGFTIRTEGSQSQTHVAKGWPEQFGKRKLYSCEYGSIYAGKKSGADQAKKVLEIVVKDLRQAGVTKPTDGLILVMDNNEKPPIELTTLIEAAKKANTQKAGEKSEDPVKALAEAKEKMEEAGLEMEVVLSIVPIPIGLAGLPEIFKEFPEDVDQQIGWCIIVPTDGCVKAGLKKIIDVGMKKEKVGLAERLMLGALMPLIEHKATEQIKKTWQAMLYQLVLDAEKDLPEQQKQEMLKAYKQKLGLDDESKGDHNK